MDFFSSLKGLFFLSQNTKGKKEESPFPFSTFRKLPVNMLSIPHTARSDEISPYEAGACFFHFPPLIKREGGSGKGTFSEQPQLESPYLSHEPI